MILCEANGLSSTPTSVDDLALMRNLRLWSFDWHARIHGWGMTKYRESYSNWGIKSIFQPCTISCDGTLCSLRRDAAIVHGGYFSSTTASRCWLVILSSSKR